MVGAALSAVVAFVPEGGGGEEVLSLDVWEKWFPKGEQTRCTWSGVSKGKREGRKLEKDGRWAQI